MFGRRRDNQAGLLGDRNELRRSHHPAHGMVPAKQRLEAGNDAGIKGDERLIIDFCSGMVYTATVIILGPEGVPYDWVPVTAGARQGRCRRDIGLENGSWSRRLPGSARGAIFDATFGTVLLLLVLIASGG
jgi:hypothetical protein